MLVSFQGKTTAPQHQGQRGFLQYRPVKQILSPPEEMKCVMASVSERGRNIKDALFGLESAWNCRGEKKKVQRRIKMQTNTTWIIWYFAAISSKYCDTLPKIWDWDGESSSCGRRHYHYVTNNINDGSAPSNCVSKPQRHWMWLSTQGLNCFPCCALKMYMGAEDAFKCILKSL